MNTIEKGNRIPALPYKVSDFEQQYLEVRKKEQRYYTNDQITSLPDISDEHPHYAEWQFRKKSCNRLVAYLKKAKMPINILEVGCGNGWLSSKMADVENTTVTGVDINAMELKQGSIVFKHKRNLYFQYGDIRDGMFENQKFDIIVFAASVQYFPSLSQILQKTFGLLTQGGEIHILDSPLYGDGETIAAKERTKSYYQSLGFPSMEAFYFHHALSDLKPFNFKIMFNPFSITNKLLRKHDPFYWISIP